MKSFGSLWGRDAVSLGERVQQARAWRSAEGELSRACAALVAPALENKDGVADKLRAKHPRAQPARLALLALGAASSVAVPVGVSIPSIELVHAQAGGPRKQLARLLRAAVGFRHERREPGQLD